MAQVEEESPPARQPSTPAARPKKPSAPEPVPQPEPAPAPPPEPAPEPATEALPRTDTVIAADTAAAPPSSAEAPPPVDTASAPEPSVAPGAEPTESSDTVAYRPYPSGATAPDPAEVESAAAASEAAGMLGVGTVINAMLEDSIHSRIDVSGKEVQGRVMDNVTGVDGAVLVPAGSLVRFTVTQVKPGRGGRKGVLEIRTDSITIQGQPRELQATIRSVPYQLRGRGVTGEEAVKVGVGAAGGAVAGRVITGSTKGAVIGGVIGAAGGAVVASETAQKDVVVKAKTPVQLVLTAPLSTR